jgi:hypothetical protein
MEVHVMTTLSGEAGPGAAETATVPASPALRLTAAVLVVGAVEFAAGSLGLWWVTFLLGLVAGWLAPRRGKLVALSVGTVLAWALGIAVQSGLRTFDVAGVVSAMALNARGLGWVVAALAIVYALLLAFAGVWLGGAARRLIRGGSRRGEPPTVTPRPESAATPAAAPAAAAPPESAATNAKETERV